MRDTSDRTSKVTSRFDIDCIPQIGRFRFVEEIVRKIYDYILYALFDLEAMMRFECRSDV